MTCHGRSVAGLLVGTLVGFGCGESGSNTSGSGGADGATPSVGGSVAAAAAGDAPAGGTGAASGGSAPLGGGQSSGGTGGGAVVTGATGPVGGSSSATTGGVGPAASGGAEAASTGGVGADAGGSPITGGSTGVGGQATAAGGGEAAAGTGGAPTAATGGVPGTGGGLQAGTGGNPTAGTGGEPPAGTGGEPTAATGGSSGAETTRYLSDLCDLGDGDNAWGPVEKDLSNGEQAGGDGGPLVIDNVVFSKGLGMHAPSEIGYRPMGACSTLSAVIGVDDEMRDAGSVVFEVWGDGTLLYQSAVITGGDGATPIEVDVTGVQELRLVASDNGGNGSDHADWAEATLTCAGDPIAICEKTPTTVEVPAGYSLVWSDEFDTEGRPNPANWGYEQGFVRNNELQWYQEENAWVQSGFLIIEGRRLPEPDPSRENAEYTSSSLRSMGHQTWRYGHFEMRARIATLAGLWPAWWTLGVSGEWPSNGEIDIMEYYGDQLHANVACGTTERWVARWDSAARAVSSFGDDDWDAKFHVWTMDWDDQTIALYLDGEQLNTTHLADMLNPDGQSPFRQEHYMLINLAIGGNAGGDPSGTEFPTRYEVDYVRVFQAG